jgi:hypothetical protein
MEALEFFKNRKIAIATKHEKEKILKPLLKAALNVDSIVPQNFDTDIFGTFTREKKRTGNQLEAARKKAFAAMKVTGLDLAIASEGSFDAYAPMPFITSNFELVLLIDAKNKIEVRGHSRTLETNMAHICVSSVPEAITFAQSVGFPEHGVIIRKNEDSKKMFKEVLTWNEFKSVCRSMIDESEDGTLFLETDMRAHRNPTRMKNIELAVKDLIQNIQSTCPQCGIFGFVPVEIAGYLVCDSCGSDTDIPGKYIYKCQKCNSTEERWVNGKMYIGHEECLECNP